MLFALEHGGIKAILTEERRDLVGPLQGVVHDDARASSGVSHLREESGVRDVDDCPVPQNGTFHQRAVQPEARGDTQPLEDLDGHVLRLLVRAHEDPVPAVRERERVATEEEAQEESERHNSIDSREHDEPFRECHDFSFVEVRVGYCRSRTSSLLPKRMSGPLRKVESILSRPLLESSEKVTR